MCGTVPDVQTKRGMVPFQPLQEAKRQGTVARVTPNCCRKHWGTVAKNHAKKFPELFRKEHVHAGSRLETTIGNTLVTQKITISISMNITSPRMIHDPNQPGD